MDKSKIQKIRIDVVSNDISALSLMISADGAIGRQGNGVLPADPTSIIGQDDSNVFHTLIEQLDEAVFPYANVYDHPHKLGIPITCSIAFQAEETPDTIFEFRFGSETTDVGELLPYFDAFIAQAIELTNEWYATEKAKLNNPTLH